MQCTGGRRKERSWLSHRVSELRGRAEDAMELGEGQCQASVAHKWRSLKSDHKLLLHYFFKVSYVKYKIKKR